MQRQRMGWSSWHDDGRRQADNFLTTDFDHFQRKYLPSNCSLKCTTESAQVSAKMHVITTNRNIFLAVLCVLRLFSDDPMPNARVLAHESWPTWCRQLDGAHWSTCRSQSALTTSDFGNLRQSTSFGRHPIVPDYRSASMECKQMANVKNGLLVYSLICNRSCFRLMNLRSVDVMNRSGWYINR